MRPRFLAIFPMQCAVPLDMRARVRRHLPHERTAGATWLFHDADVSCVELAHSQGWIIGTLFTRANGEAITSLPPNQDLAVGSTGGQSLVSDFWGSYAALWQDSSGMLQVLRDPSGVLPVYHARAGDLCFVTSDIALLVQTGIVRPQPDWDMVLHGLLYAQLPTARTHLKHIVEILPGRRLAVTAEAISSELLWKPWTFASHCHPARDAVALATNVAAAVDDSVAAWAAVAQKVNLELSGGLDSSIVAASLARSGRTFCCTTIASPGHDGDERDYARAVAEYLGAPLTEIMTTADDADPLARLPRWTPRPRGMRVIAGLDTLFDKAACEAGADALFSGGGGDNVFCFTGATAPVLDALAANGVAAARDAARDVAAVTHTTLAQVYAHAFKRWIVDRTGRRWAADRSFLSRDCWAPAHGHPWLALPKGTASGTRAHIGAIVRIHDILDAHRRAAARTMVFPLMSQPVLEACLAVPSWYWVSGGRDRSLARAAFALRLPRRVVQRASKGVLNSLITPAFEKSRRPIRALLCEGYLAGAGLLNRKAIDAAFAASPEARASSSARLLELVDAELWLRDVMDSDPVALDG